MAQVENGRERRMDIASAIVVLVIAIVAFTISLREPPAHYDPLGPGAVPMVVAISLCALGLILLARAAMGLRIGQAAQSLIGGLDADDSAIDYPLRPGLAAFAYASTAAYVATIGLDVPFFWATFAFLAGVGLAMARMRRPLIYWVLCASLAGTFIVEYLFRIVLLVPLP